MHKTSCQVHRESMVVCLQEQQCNQKPADRSEGVSLGIIVLFECREQNAWAQIIKKKRRKLSIGMPSTTKPSDSILWRHLFWQRSVSAWNPSRQTRGWEQPMATHLTSQVTPNFRRRNKTMAPCQAHHLSNALHQHSRTVKSHSLQFMAAVSDKLALPAKDWRYYQS